MNKDKILIYIMPTSSNLFLMLFLFKDNMEKSRSRLRLKRERFSKPWLSLLYEDNFGSGIYHYKDSQFCN